jgi:hypothetical protein
MRRLFFVACAALLVGFFGGCAQSGTPKVETVQAPAPDPIARVKAMLTNYANGMPVTSEADSFADLAAKVKEKDPAKGEIVEKGLQEIKANPGSAKSKATELLKKL